MHIYMYISVIPCEHHVNTMVFSVNYCSNFNDTAQYIDETWISFMYYMYFVFHLNGVEKESIGVGGVGFPLNFAIGKAKYKKPGGEPCTPYTLLSFIADWGPKQLDVSNVCLTCL